MMVKIARGRGRWRTFDIQDGLPTLIVCAGVRFIDETGIRLLQRWSGERLVVQGASPFVQMLLGIYELA